ncbi:MAG: DEAD/DEAH box helicase [Candidatus Peribacteraceae bacterium]|nr:DEAD/DEAH box helicase [Candidatus Peribacteraceae bacterium]
MISNPLEIVSEYFRFPFTAHEFQDDVIIEQAPLNSSGVYMDVGTGKTFVSTAIALFKGIVEDIDHVIVIMPPVLITAWSMWIDEVEVIPGGKLSQCVYRGSPDERKAMDLNADFILMSTNIFRNDFKRIDSFFKGKKAFVIVDEATSVRNVKTKTHRRFKQFVTTAKHQFTLLTGTAISSPGHCYGYIRLLAPGVYRSEKHFDSIHVAERDFFDQVIAWQNLDLLSENFMLNSVRVLADDVLELPETVYDVTPYELDDKHNKLYKQLADERLLLLPDGSKIDATQAQSLYNDLQRIVLNPEEYMGEPHRPAGYDIMDSMLEELGSDKLIAFNNYRMSNRRVTAYLLSKGYDAVACYGEVSRKKQEVNLQRFLHDPKCQVLVASPRSIGVGLNLQKACRCMLFLELPVTPEHFNQCVGRIRRDGQTRKILIKIAIALKTIQVMLQHRLVSKDELVQTVSPSKVKLKKLIFGESA